MTLRKFPNLSGPQNQLWKKDNSYTVSEGFEKMKEVKAYKNPKAGLLSLFLSFFSQNLGY